MLKCFLPSIKNLVPILKLEGEDEVRRLYSETGYSYTILRPGLDIFYGANAVDYSGYPDCRPEYVESFERMANLATKAGVEAINNDNRFRVHAPIIGMSKSEIIQLGATLGVDYSQTVSCYQANDLGEACGECESCRLRQVGFKSAGVADPTRYRN